MGELSIWHDDTEFVIAASAEDAAEILRAMDCGYDIDVDAFERWEPTRPFTLDPCDGTAGVTKTAAEWVAERGRGWLATTEY